MQMPKTQESQESIQQTQQLYWYHSYRPSMLLHILSIFRLPCNLKKTECHIFYAKIVCCGFFFHHQFSSRNELLVIGKNRQENQKDQRDSKYYYRKIDRKTKDACYHNTHKLQYRHPDSPVNEALQHL